MIGGRRYLYAATWSCGCCFAGELLRAEDLTDQRDPLISSLRHHFLTRGAPTWQPIGRTDGYAGGDIDRTIDIITRDWDPANGRLLNTIGITELRCHGRYDCRLCLRELPVDCFGKSKRRRGGKRLRLQRWCKDCMRHYARMKYQLKGGAPAYQVTLEVITAWADEPASDRGPHPGAPRQHQADAPPPAEKRCGACRQVRPAEKFSPSGRTRARLEWKCKACHRLLARLKKGPGKVADPYAEMIRQVRAWGENPTGPHPGALIRPARKKAEGVA